MQDLPVPRDDINLRLRKIEGQLRGIQNMVSQERDCVDVLTQLSSVKNALESVAGLVLRNYASICAKEEDEPDLAKKLAHAVSIWVGGRT